MKPNEIILRIEVDAEHDYLTFMGKLVNQGLVSEYKLQEITLPVHYFRNEFINYVAEHGLSSLLNFSIVMEDIMSPAIHINDIEATIIKFVQHISPAKRFLVVDPYFHYGKVTDKNHERFTRLISPLLTTLEELVIISDNQRNNNLSNMQQAFDSELKAASSNLTITRIESSIFHDRFWINLDDQEGLVIGTSLNGIGKSISIIDHLKTGDVISVLSEIQAAGIAL